MTISASALTIDKSTTLTSTKTTASVALHSGKLALLAIGVTNAAPVPTVSSVTSAGTTWELVHALTYGINTARMELWRTMPPSNQTGAITINLSAVPSVVTWSVVEFSNVTVTGLYGAGAIVQVDEEIKTTGNGGIVNLAALGSTDNAAYGFWTCKLSTNINNGSGFTEFHEKANVAPNLTLETEWKINDNSVDASWSGSSPSAGIAVEIGEGGPVTPVAMSVDMALTPTLGLARGKLLSVDLNLVPTMMKNVGKRLDVVLDMAASFVKLTEGAISLAADLVLTATMDVLKLGRHGNYVGHQELKANYRGSTDAG